MNSVDRHALQKSRVITVKARKQWHIAELALEKQLRRQYEKKHKRSQLNMDKSQLQEHRIKCNTLPSYTMNDYIRNKIENAHHQKICDNL